MRRRSALQAYGPLPFALSLAGGEAESVDELVAAVDDGIYITRVHYLGIVDPRRGVLTGMTRDGTFRIRDGKIAEPLVNLRFTIAVPDLLADVPALSREVTLVNQSDFYGERYPVAALVPGDRDGALQRHGRRLDAGHLAHVHARVVDEAARVFAPAAYARRDEARIDGSRDRDSPRRRTAREERVRRSGRETRTSSPRSRHDAASSVAP